MMTTNNWICDKCNQTIKSVDDGWFEWLRNNENNKLSKFQIVHHLTCIRDEHIYYKKGFGVLGNHLKYFVGETGLVRLLELISSPDLENQKYLLEMIQRIQISGYETARFHFEEAYSDGYIDSAKHGVYYLSIEQINNINQKYN